MRNAMFTGPIPSASARPEDDEKARALIRRVVLLFSVFGRIRLECDTLGDEITVCVWMQVPDRRQPADADPAQPKITVVSLTRYVSFAELELVGWSLDFFAGRVRSILHEIVMHEVDEMLMVDGRRAFDPHAQDAQLRRGR